jgi:hypothetical protein
VAGGNVVNVDDAAFYNRETGELETVAEMRERAINDSDDHALLIQIDQTLTDLERRIANMESKMTSTESVIQKVAAEVMPTINQLMESPMLKMLGVKKTK